MEYKEILYEVEEPIGRIIFNRPKSLNALSNSLMEEFSSALDQAQKDSKVRVVIISGVGRSFSAGYDLNEVEEFPVIDWYKWLSNQVSLVMKVWDIPKPVIAQVQGHCLGGACELAMACDLTIAAENAQFGEPEVQIGTGPVTLMMPWIIGLKKTKELLYTGEAINAQEAERIGMVNRVVALEELESETEILARKVSRVPVEVFRLTKASINRTYEIMGLQSALQSSVDLGSILHAAGEPEQIEFMKIAKQSGLKAALEWSKRRFSE